MFTPARYEATGNEMDRVLDLTAVGGGRALDLCCGPGRCAIALARRGFEVTGVDRTGYLLAKARRRARAAGARVRFLRTDIRDYRSPESFDLIVNMYTSIGYFADREDDRRVFRNVFASLRPGGRCIFELGGREGIAGKFQATGSRRLPDGSLLIERREIVEDWTRIRSEWIVIRDGRARQFEIVLRLYSGQELRQELERAGFEVRLYGNLEGDPYGSDASRLVAIGTRPGKGD
jgi:SAM-dependent methyltransferase